MSTEMRTNIITNQLIQIPELSGMKNKFPISDFFLRIFMSLLCHIDDIWQRASSQIFSDIFKEIKI